MLTKKYWIIFSLVLVVNARAVDMLVPQSVSPEQESMQSLKFSSAGDGLGLKKNENNGQKMFFKPIDPIICDQQKIASDLVELLPETSKRSCKRSRSVDSYTTRKDREQAVTEGEAEIERSRLALATEAAFMTASREEVNKEVMLQEQHLRSNNALLAQMQLENAELIKNRLQLQGQLEATPSDAIAMEFSARKVATNVMLSDSVSRKMQSQMDSLRELAAEHQRVLAQIDNERRALKKLRLLVRHGLGTTIEPVQDPRVLMQVSSYNLESLGTKIDTREPIMARSKRYRPFFNPAPII